MSVSRCVRRPVNLYNWTADGKLLSWQCSSRLSDWMLNRPLSFLATATMRLLFQSGRPVLWSCKTIIDILKLYIQ